MMMKQFLISLFTIPWEHKKHLEKKKKKLLLTSPNWPPSALQQRNGLLHLLSSFMSLFLFLLSLLFPFLFLLLLF